MIASRSSSEELELKELRVQVKKLTCVVSHLVHHFKMVRQDMNHLGDTVIDRIIPDIHSTDIDEVDQLFNEVFDFKFD